MGVTVTHKIWIR